MSGQAAAANPPQQDAPVANDAGKATSAAQAQVTSKLLDDSRVDRPGSDSSKPSNGTQKDNTDTNAGGNGNDTSIRPNDASNDSGDVASTANEQIRREVDDEYKTPEAKKLFNSAQLSPDVMAKFGTPEFVDEAKADAGKPDQPAEVAAADPDVTAAKPEDGKTTDSTGVFSDVANWASSTFNDYIAEPAKDALGSMLDMYGTASEWMFESGAQGSDQVAAAPKAIADLNNVSVQDFREQRNDTMDKFKFDVKSADGLEMPANATADGTVDVGGNRMTVFRTPDGKTFLKRGDKVVAEQDKEGNYDLSLSDNTTAKVRLSKEGDQYKLDNLERYKGDQLQQKFSDGVYYNYNYDAQGNRSVDAAADLKGPMSQEQLDQRLASIRGELGPNGTAALRFQQEGQQRRLLMQTHGENTYSITDVDQKRAQIFHDGKEFRLNENDELGIVNKDGSWNKVDDSNKPADAEPDSLKDIVKRTDERAKGDGKTAVDGVTLDINPDNGDAVINRVNPDTGEQLSHTEMPASADQPVKVTNDTTGEVATLDGAKLSLDDKDGNQILGFDPNSGFNTNEFAIDQNGLTDLETGMNLDQDGNVFDGNGDFISGSAGTDWYFPECDNSVTEHQENMQTSQDTSSMVSNLGSISLSISRSGNPNAVGIARQVASEALGLASAALSDLGNDFLAQIPVYNSQSIAEAALNQSVSEERTQTYAMRMGITDTTRLSEFNRVATLSSTSFSPEEFVRNQMRVA